MNTNKTSGPEELPDGFSKVSVGGGRKTYRIKHWKDVGESSKEIVVCGRLWCNGETHDEEGQSYGKEIEFISDDGKQHVVVISNAELQGDGSDLRKRFADLGLFISTNRSARDSFSQLLNTIRGPRRIVVVSKAGFHVEDEASAVSNVFVSPVGHVIHSRKGLSVNDATPIEPDIEGTDSGLRYRLNPNRGVQDKRVGGSYKAWQDGVGKKIFQEDIDPDTKIGVLRLPHFVLGLFSGCAGTVIQYANEPSSGLHFVGGSSRGKSSAQVIGASCWANPSPDKGVLITCHGTKNALDMKLMLSNGASIHLDEARTGEEKTIVNLPFQFAGETVKGRLKSDAELRKILTWKGFMTLSSEKAISHYAARAGDQVIAGGVVRMPSIDISGLQPIDPNEARAIKEAALENFGHVGPRFAEALMRRTPEQVRAMINDAEDQLRTDNTAPTVIRARRVFATLYVVGAIMREARIIAADDLRVYRAVKWGWQAFLTGEEAAALNPAEQSVDALLLWLRSNPHLVRRTEDKFAPREVMAWYDDRFVYLPTANLSKIAAVTTSSKAVLEELDEQGLLEWESDKNRQHGYIPKVGETKHYRLNVRIDVTGDTQDEQRQIEWTAKQRAKSGEKPVFAYR